jgi:PAS domain S-box-containing protein
MNDDAGTSRFNEADKYRLLVEAVTDYAMYMLDPSGLVASWNSGAQRLKGYTEAEILGRHFSTFYTPEDVHERRPWRALAAAAERGRFEAEGWRVRKDGTRFWAHVVIDPIRSAAGDLLGYAKVTRDLSERRAAEEVLFRSEQQFRLLVQGVTDYAIFMLDVDGIVTNWNAGAQRIKGYAAAEVVGTHFSRFYPEEDRARGAPARALAIAAAEGRFESEGWRIRKEGTRFWANVVIDAIRGDDGQIIGFAKITRDVTERRQAQLELEQAREALFQSQKLDAIGQLTGGIAHDFNNLLMVVLSSLELVRRHLPDDEKLRRYVETAVGGARRGVSLTQRMLAFARRQDLKPAAVDIAQLVHGMMDMLSRSLGPAIRIELDFPAELPAAHVDPNQLELAILNLAVNGRDAMEENGSLAISAREARFELPEQGLAAGRYVCLSVTDSGAGMDAATLERATEPFFTTKGIGKGTGLGLPMVHGLAGQSGGRFVLRSSLGVGTTAELWLPVAGDLQARSMPAAPAARERAAPLRILVVDDDLLVLANTVAMVEELGHSARQASSGSEALALLQHDASIQLLLTDQAMPGMSGVQLIEAAHRERPALPVILASGFAELPASVSVVGRVRLDKPYDQQRLARAIEESIAGETA